MMVIQNFQVNLSDINFYFNITYIYINVALYITVFGNKSIVI